jgi:hypothetical protein
MKRSAALLLAILCGAGYAQNPLAAAVLNISNTGVFAFGGVGFIGKTSQGEIDFRVIESQPPTVALEEFERVYATGDAAAKSYALVGIRQLDRKRFNELLQSLQDSQQNVLTMQGCVLQKQKLVDVVKTIDAGGYDGYMKAQ